MGVCFVPALDSYPNKAAKTLLLKKPLREISGISFHSPGQLAAINDEEGKLFILSTTNGKFNTLSFGKKGDYEDITRSPEGYYVLKSNGNLHLLDGRTGQEKMVYRLRFGKFTEFESLCFDAEKNRLLLICKTCEKDEPAVYAWAFNLDTHSLEETPVFRIDWKEIRRLGKDDTLEFFPSAAEFHPLTGKLFILSATDKLLLQCSREGVPEKITGLNPDLFQQPEGLCFTPNGDLFISNEGRQSKASLLFFPYQAPASAGTR
ncbi:SdiA-regulated domain-containing protein [Flavihumibacter sp. CACIAM 22H1]|uniref:SdiA-regulated domain-containing protein n=1 Tax=Flavihumibacter sp. CACIAM 22H1 TaxID=1812911 RepID=UPI0007A8F506|nr:SdiA-regulated domain-containing protein [Flavihumibacter sp. CACIAM 22H1]KYP15715.1 MAG: hypothetical protein A1D16_19330 [Flavihumibacter sp. CACIAM 22H1]